MKKAKVAAFSVAVIAIIVISAFASTQINQPAQTTPTPTPPVEVAAKKPFYVGVTYCGNSTNEARGLIDTVKNYTNLFVVQSGPLMSNWPALEQICDYAVNSNLSIIVYFARNGDANNVYKQFLNVAEDRWGSRFLGVYFNDEQGGKMIDYGLALYDNSTGGMISVSPHGYLSQSIPPDAYGVSYNYDFRASGEITIYMSQRYSDNSNLSNETTYFKNGTVQFSSWYIPFNDMPVTRQLWYQTNGVYDENGTAVFNAGDRSQFDTYQEALSLRPLTTHEKAADLFVGGVQNILTWVRNISDARLFTSEYALDWFNYQAGYDVVLAQLGWGQSATQNIARIRGAATIQNRSWGTMITWASAQAPYLMSGEQMFQEMRQSYRSGAEYVVVFNYNQTYNAYGENATSTGTALLQEEHYAAIEKFWKDVVENPAETNNATGSVAFVLPQYYGWGMRHMDDKIWGLWTADDTAHQIWSKLQDALSTYGSRLDIVYEDPAYPASSKYSQLLYWNNTG